MKKLPGNFKQAIVNNCAYVIKYKIIVLIFSRIQLINTRKLFITQTKGKFKTCFYHVIICFDDIILHFPTVKLQQLI